MRGAIGGPSGGPSVSDSPTVQWLACLLAAACNALRPPRFLKAQRVQCVRACLVPRDLPRPYSQMKGLIRFLRLLQRPTRPSRGAPASRRAPPLPPPHRCRRRRCCYPGLMPPDVGPSHLHAGRQLAAAARCASTRWASSGSSSRTQEAHRQGWQRGSLLVGRRLPYMLAGCGCHTGQLPLEFRQMFPCRCAASCRSCMWDGTQQMPTAQICASATGPPTSFSC